MIRYILIASTAVLTAPAFAQGAGHTGTAGSDTFHDEPGAEVVSRGAFKLKAEAIRRAGG